MTIEFRCTNCDKLLRTPAGTEGKQAKCPDCGALMTIPANSAFSPPPREPEFRPGPPESNPQPPASRPREPELRPREPAFGPAPGATAPRDSGNPFQSPSIASTQPEWGAARRGFEPTRIELGTVVDQGWRIYKDNFGLLAASGLIVLAIPMFLGFGIVMLGVVVFGVDPAADNQVKLQAINAVQNLISNIVQTFLTLGMVRLTLNMARHERASIADVFSAGGRLLVLTIVTNIVIGISMLLGFLLCIVPGIWIGLTLCLTWYMLLDQNVGMLDALKYSARATRGNKWVLLGLFLVSLGLMMLVGLPTCGIGMIFVYPFFMLLLTVAYLGATGQLGVGPVTSAPAAASYMTPPPTFE
jgi:hypothetical protein